VDQRPTTHRVVVAAVTREKRRKKKGSDHCIKKVKAAPHAPFTQRDQYKEKKNRGVSSLRNFTKAQLCQRCVVRFLYSVKEAINLFFFLSFAAQHHHTGSVSSSIAKDVNYGSHTHISTCALQLTRHCGVREHEKKPRSH
jgi:hypothetical protein